tara:strand:+ start:1015 stop:1197 length:183 start_codon:yes stop_codon:yes gene_type:complete
MDREGEMSVSAKDDLRVDLRSLPSLSTEHGDRVEEDRDRIEALADAIERYVDRRLAERAR